MAEIRQNLITLPKKLRQQYQKMSKEDVFGRKLFKNSYKICVYWVSEVAWSNLYTSKNTSQGRKFRCKRTNNLSQIYNKHILMHRCFHSYHLDIIIHDNINDVNDVNNIIIKTQEVINCLSWVFKGSATQRRKNHVSKVAMLPGK